jgi:photosystem II stability/assembly factor-like uncharacterized protein
MSNLSEVLSQAAINPDFPTDNPDSAIAIIDSLELIGFSPDSALLFVVFAEKAPLSSSLMRTHTVVLKTSDGGNNWRLTLDATQGSLVKEEIFFLNETQGWFVTQWQVEATFPTLYSTTDFGETWQESSSIHEAITAKGGVASFTEAQGLRFKSEQEGIVIGKTFNVEGENIQLFLKTNDGGQTWQEINNIPAEYFTWNSIHSQVFDFSHTWQITTTVAGILISKSVDLLATIYPAAISNG